MKKRGCEFEGERGKVKWKVWWEESERRNVVSKRRKKMYFFSKRKHVFKKETVTNLWGRI